MLFKGQKKSKKRKTNLIDALASGEVITLKTFHSDGVNPMEQSSFRIVVHTVPAGLRFELEFIW